MFKRIRQLKISLAAKCQLLFGVAVVLIISAALFVPWQRMEELTRQVDEQAARTLAKNAILEHAARPYARLPSKSEPDSDQPNIAASGTGEQSFVPLRFIAAAKDSESRGLTPFERRAMATFRKEPDKDSVTRNYDREDGSVGYRYALALYAEQSCLRCHAIDNGEFSVRSTPAATAPATHPASHVAPLVGMVTVDIRSNVDTTQLLLNRVFILAAGLFAGMLAIIVFYLITTRLILQPVRVLQETAEKVSQGDLNIRSDISTGDEFQQLSETFNVMLTNLKLSADQLRAINKSLDLKLGQLAESNVALYESNRLKSEFLANVSHELRTPLNSILGFAELLRDSIAQDGKGLRYIQNILGSGKNLLDLINDLLDLAKIEAGRMEVRSEPISLTDLFEGLGGILKPLCEGKSLTLGTSVATDVPIIHTDPAKLQQVLYNFLSNAIKFSPTGANIALTAEKDTDGNVRISVTDQGPGIGLDDQSVIFEKFRQLDGSVTREHSGTGLGLAISKELIALLGGTIGIQSVPGEGATFWVSLPPKIEAGSQDIRAKLVLS